MVSPLIVSSHNTMHGQDIETDFLPTFREKLEVYAKVAQHLLEEYRSVFQIAYLGKGISALGARGNPVTYDRFMCRILLLQRMEAALRPRELNLVYGPSGTEKAYKSTIRKQNKQCGTWLCPDTERFVLIPGVNSGGKATSVRTFSHTPTKERPYRCVR